MTIKNYNHVQCVNKKKSVKINEGGKIQKKYPKKAADFKAAF
jgi:hypothetical protein